MMQLNKLDGRHKLAVVGAFVCWGLSMYFSKEGFSVGNTVMLWVGWVLAGIVTIVELVFNSPTQRLSLTLIVVGVICYLYGIYTNVTGFWGIQHPDQVFVALSSNSLMSYFVGFTMEVLPEPLFMWGIASAFDGDFLGNLAGLWSGKLPYAQPGNNPNSNQKSQQKITQPNFQSQKSKYKPQHKPHSVFPTLRQNPQFPTKQQQMPTYHPISMQGRPPMEDTDEEF